MALALPYPTGSISYSVEEELVNVRLLSICPPDANRPYFQEGFLVGTFPFDFTRRSKHLDFGKRLIAKFKLDFSTFWDDEFQPIPESALYPNIDVFEQITDQIKCKKDEIKREYHEKFSALITDKVIASDYMTSTVS